MNIERYRPDGRKDITANVTPAAADVAYMSHLGAVKVPFSRYYRVTLVDPLSGGRIVRDTDSELFGRQTVAPDFTADALSAGIHREDARTYYRDKGFAVGFGFKGE